MGTGVGAKVTENNNPANNDLPVSFDLETLYIPPLTSSTTKFLGFPLPPFLKIDIVPEAFHGSINQESGKVKHISSGDYVSTWKDCASCVQLLISEPDNIIPW